MASSEKSPGEHFDDFRQLPFYKKFAVLPIVASLATIGIAGVEFYKGDLASPNQISTDIGYRHTPADPINPKGLEQERRAETTDSHDLVTDIEYGGAISGALGAAELIIYWRRRDN